MTSTRRPERTLFVVGLFLCLLYVNSLGYRAIGSRAAVRSFQALTQASNAPTFQTDLAKVDTLSVDQSLWSENRISAYLDSLASQFEPPLAILRIPKVNIQVPVFEGTDELVLNRGAGRIAGTALPGESGNVGIAGHRDGFFRALKDIAIGDFLTLSTVQDTATYVVDRITIVSPEDISVLNQTSTPSVTLVTCYPFYFIGHAPQRYIVHAR